MAAESLRDKIEAKVQAARQRRAERREAVEQAMIQLEHWQERFDVFAGEWLERVASPKLLALVDAFPHGTVPERPASSHRATAILPRCDTYPAEVQVDIGLVPDPTRGRCSVDFHVSIVPILMHYTRGESLEIDLEAPDRAAIDGFLEERILQFVTEYLSIAEADSPYQRGRLVTDPVCGMSFPRAEAASTLEHERQTYSFCTATCRQQFESHPQRYA